MVQRENWPQDNWAAPLLTGKAHAVYYDMEEEAAMDYVCLKAEILSHYQLDPRDRAQWFQDWKYTEVESPRGQLYHLIHLVRRWLCLTKTTSEMLETLVIDKCLRELQVTVH